jgi:3-hydroxy-3-methylglutaryl CoA synthase
MCPCLLACLFDNLATDNRQFTVDSADAFLFHTPYCKLIQKSLARLVLNDFLSDPNPDYAGKYAGLEAFRFIAFAFIQFSVTCCHYTLALKFPKVAKYGDA